jgi:hypothetical protein
MRHEGRPVSLQQRSYWRRLALIPLWDAVAVAIWALSFLRSSIRWRGSDYYIRGGVLVPVNPGLGKSAV